MKNLILELLSVLITPIAVLIMIFNQHAQADSGFALLEATIREYDQPWIITPCIRKSDTGEDTQRKICTVWKKALAKGLTPTQAKYGVIALVDHESAGTWSPTIKGDNGCSIGLGQWNSCPGSNRRAAKGFDAQADQIVDEMAAKMAIYPIAKAICLHNSPAGYCNADYVNLVRNAAKLFN